ncbi:MAG: DUF6111 family protein [Pseudomonadota bacterium]
MLRLVLINIALFVLPLAIYAIYFWLTRRDRDQGALSWKDMPLANLLQAGLGLIIIGMLVTAYTGGESPEGDYVPARIENGRIVPGKVQ